MTNNNIAPMTILFVDDEAELLDFYALSLKRQRVRILKVPGGEEAIEILSRVTPQVAVLDLAMPDVSGIDVLRYIRSQPNLAAMKVIILTAVPTMLDELDDVSADLVLIKPISPSKLEDAIVSILNRMSTSEAQQK